MRVAQPLRDDGPRLHYRIHGAGEPALLMPARDTWVRDELANAPAWLLAAGIADQYAAGVAG